MTLFGVDKRVVSKRVVSADVPPERKPERGHVRQNHPFTKPPLYLPVTFLAYQCWEISCRSPADGSRSVAETKNQLLGVLLTGTQTARRAISMPRGKNCPETMFAAQSLKDDIKHSLFWLLLLCLLLLWLLLLFLLCFPWLLHSHWRSQHGSPEIWCWWHSVCCWDGLNNSDLSSFSDLFFLPFLWEEAVWEAFQETIWERVIASQKYICETAGSQLSPRGI